MGPVTRRPAVAGSQTTSHMIAHAGREAGGWFCVLALSVSLAAAMTRAVTSAPQEPESLLATTRMMSGSNLGCGSDARSVVREASIATAPNADGPYVPDGIPDGADAWAAGKVQLDTLELDDSCDCCNVGEHVASWSS